MTQTNQTTQLVPITQPSPSLLPVINFIFYVLRLTSHALRLLISFLLTPLIILCFWSTPAWAADFSVNCGDVPGLITAITNANASSEADTITLNADNQANCIYTLTAVNNSTFGDNGLPTITTEITIEGRGAIIARSSAGGTPDFRLFAVVVGEENAGNLTLKEVTVSNGRPSGGLPGGGIFNFDGTMRLINSTVSGNTGGIFNDGMLTLTNSAVSDNSGDGIDNQRTLTLANSVISNNTGLGIVNYGTLTLINSTINNNTSFGIVNLATLTLTNSTVSGNTGDLGGGISNEGGGPVILTNSTVSGNTSTDSGGGIFNNGTLTLINSTLSGNTASNSGGGIFNDGGTLTLINSTISSNTATDGGGLFNNSTLTLTNSIVAAQIGGGDCAGAPITANSFNLDSDGSCGDATTGAPQLGPLADNGGPTQTHALLAGSPALSAADPGACPATDQRGVNRPQGSGCDIGAFESNISLGSSPPIITPTVSGRPGNNDWYTSDVTVSWTVTDDESPITSTTGCDPTTLTTDTTVAGVTLTCEATSAGGTASASITIRRDATPPTITSNAAPPANSNGWNNSSVTVSFICEDASPGSGLTSCGPDQTLSNDGANQPITGAVTDNAGNSASATISNINLDQIAPDTVINAGPPPVTGSPSASFTFSGSDSLSGVAGFECQLDSGGFTPCNSGSQAYNGLASGEHIFRVRAADAAGNPDLTPASFTFLFSPSIQADDPTFIIPRNFGDRQASTQSVAVGDMDGDGDLDIVVANPLQQSMVHMNDGQANFTTVRNFGGNQDNTSKVAIGDMDGDGDLDIVAGKLGEQSMVYLNDGQANFTTSHDFGANTDIISNVAVGDMDGDGDLDIVVRRWQQQSVVYLNDGQANFITSRTFGLSGDDDFAMAVGDMDDDGDLDVVMGNQFQQSIVYLNDGGANFTSSRNFGTSTDIIPSVAVGDMDGDGDLDIVASSLEVVYLNDGQANFTTSRNFGTRLNNSQSIAVGDMDGDGDLDIVTGSFQKQSMVYLNDGQVNFPTSRNFGTGRDDTNSVAVGDMDGDGDLDIITGNDEQQSVVYLSNGGGNFTTTGHFFNLSDQPTLSLAVGDMDGDGDLDIVTGMYEKQNVVYLNDGRANFTTGRAFGPSTNATLSVAVGDMDGDGDLDIVTGNQFQQSMVYLNDGRANFTSSRDFGPSTNVTPSVVVGDMDGDGDLDIVTGNYQQEKVVYLNDGQANFTTSRTLVANLDITKSVAVGDIDSDGDLDIIAGNFFQQSRLYLNDGKASFTTSRNFGASEVDTWSVVVGDMDGDSDLDIIMGNDGQQNMVYLNDGGGNFTTSRNFGTGQDDTHSLAVGDMDGDGDLDIVTGNEFQQSVIYLNDGESNFISRRAFGAGRSSIQAVAVGDMDGDGDLDIILDSFGQDVVYLNGRAVAAGLANNPSLVVTTRPITTHNANFYSTPIILGGSTVSLTYTLFDAESDPVGRIAAYYSLDGGSNWRSLILTTDTLTTNLTTGPYPTPTLTNTHTLTWNVFASDILGQWDNVVIRMVAYPQPPQADTPGSYSYPYSMAGPYQWPYASATTFPFRIRGSQVQVLSGTVPISNAIAYRLPAGQLSGGQLFADGAGQPFRTNGQGYLQGRGQIGLGDHLLALAPVPLPPPYSELYSGTVRLYYTNGTAAPDISGLTAFDVTQPGVQQVAVSPDRPLLLFDLDVSLEWDASNNTAYLERLANELQVASEALYDFTNGQAALGRITVYQDREAWDTADIQIRATNRLRPFASQGGLVLTDTVDPDHQTPPDRIVYQPGQVTMGATWNRYGSVGQEIGQDWPLALAHELSHYLFFLDDSYMGLNEADLLLPVTSCTSSAMGDVYLQANTEFIYDEAFWQANCADTLAARTLGRTEWQTLRLWYPWAVQPTISNAGPTLMPFDFTSVDIRPPAISNNLLDDPTFELLYSGGSAAPASSNGQAFLIRGDRTIDLGSPRGDLKTVVARGAQVGDTLCAFDPPQRQYGCETIAVGDTLLELEQDTTWTPLIQLSPVNSATFTLQVENLPAGLSLNARLYPASGSPSSEISLIEVNGIYQAQFPVLSQPALAGHVRVWVSTDAATETNPRREAIAPFSIGGNPPKSRGGHAPVVSPDGQMIFFTRDEANFGPGEFYLVQSMAGLPPLPPGKKAIGPGYNLLAAPGTPVLTGSVSFQYLEVDVDTERADETQLAVHFWNGTQWRALETVGNINYNLASARSQGPGIYALLAGVTTPIVTTYDPPVATNDLTTTLTITGSNFLAPLQVELRGSTVYTLTAQVVNSATLTATLPPGLPAQEYQPVVLNGDGGSALTPGTLSLFNQEEACFYDNFESGSNKWQRSDEWGIVTFGDGNGRAMTDTPAHPYLDAPPPAITHTTAITSLAFSLANCQEPVLTFSHAYDIYNFSAPGVTSRDVGRVEISTYADQSGSWSDWQELQYFFNGVSSTGLEQAAVTSPEWYKSTDLQQVQINLSSYTGTVRLRFSLEADNTVSGKGWIIDELRVKAGSEAPPSDNSIFLPIVLKSK